MKNVIEKRKDIVFYIKLFPLVQLHPEAYDKSKAIVCEKSNAKALQLLEDVFAKKTIPAPSCETKTIDENISLATRLGISGTPALVFENGMLKSGALPADQIMQIVDSK